MLMKSDKPPLIVVKVSGKKLNDFQVWKDITDMMVSGIRVAVVHGGGVQIDEAMKKEGILVKSVGGYRVTDDRTMEIVERELLGINSMVSDALLSCGLCTKSFGYGVFHGYTMGEQWGRYGAITMTKAGMIDAVVGAGIIPVVAPMGNDYTGGKLNLDADECAASLASELRANQAILVSDVPGIKDRDGKVIREIEVHRLLKLLDNGTVNNGMIPKVKACVEAAMHGVVMKIINGNLLGAINGETAGTEVFPHR